MEETRVSTAVWLSKEARREEKGAAAHMNWEEVRQVMARGRQTAVVPVEIADPKLRLVSQALRTDQHAVRPAQEH